MTAGCIIVTFVNIGAVHAIPREAFVTRTLKASRRVRADRIIATIVLSATALIDINTGRSASNDRVSLET